MKHRVFNILSAASLMMLLGIGVLAWPYGGPEGRLVIIARPDVFHVSFFSEGIYAISATEPSDGSLLATGGYRVERGHRWRSCGFEVWKVTKGSLVGWYIWIPSLFLSAVTGVLPLCWVARNIHRLRRFPPGHCQCCGYDLRASKERCPECGTEIPQQAD